MQRELIEAFESYVAELSAFAESLAGAHYVAGTGAKQFRLFKAAEAKLKKQLDLQKAHKPEPAPAPPVPPTPPATA